MTEKTVLLKMKKYLPLIAIILLIVGSLFAMNQKNNPLDENPPLPALEPGSVYGNCRFSFIIIDEDESWFTKAELYLKIESTLYPDLKVLVPLNVGGSFSGRTTGVVELPFSHGGVANETYKIELLDEDGLEDEEIEKISELAGNTGAIIWQGAKIYATTQGVHIPISSDPVSWLAKNITSETLENLNQHWYDSYGEAEYKVLKNPPESDRDANVLSIKDDDDDILIEIKFHYLKQ